MSEKQRIEKIILLEGLTSGDFAKEIGVQTSTLSHILNERNRPSLDVMRKIQTGSVSLIEYMGETDPVWMLCVKS